MFRAFGHRKSSVLDGGLPRWEAEGLSIEQDSPAEVKRSHYPTPAFDKDTIRSKACTTRISFSLTYLILGYQQIVSNSALNPSSDVNAELVVDARSRGRQVNRIIYRLCG